MIPNIFKNIISDFIRKKCLEDIKNNRLRYLENDERVNIDELRRAQREYQRQKENRRLLNGKSVNNFYGYTESNHQGNPRVQGEKNTREYSRQFHKENLEHNVNMPTIKPEDKAIIQIIPALETEPKADAIEVPAQLLAIEPEEKTAVQTVPALETEPKADAIEVPAQSLAIEPEEKTAVQTISASETEPKADDSKQHYNEQKVHFEQNNSLENHSKFYNRPFTSMASLDVNNDLPEIKPQKIFSPFVKDTLDDFVKQRKLIMSKKKYWVDFHNKTFLSGHRYIDAEKALNNLDKEIRAIRARVSNERNDYIEKVNILYEKYMKLYNCRAFHNAQRCVEIEYILHERLCKDINYCKRRILVLLSEEENLIKQVIKNVDVCKEEHLTNIKTYYNIISQICPDIFLMSYTNADYQKICGEDISFNYHYKLSEIQQRIYDAESENYMIPNLKVGLSNESQTGGESCGD